MPLITFICRSSRSVGAALLLSALMAAAAPAARAGEADVAPSPQQDVRTCELEEGPLRAVVEVRDAETLVLDDGSEVRLSGVLAPRNPALDQSMATWPLLAEAHEALRSLVEGRSVALAYGGRRADRYGRQLAHLFVKGRDGSRVWVQGQILSQGLGRAFGLPGSTVCLEEMIAHERLARDERAGLWANAAYQLRAAHAPRELMRYRNTFQLVRGRVRKVSATRGATYLNFGADWREDFTIAVPGGLRRVSPGWFQGLKDLAGQDVVVRGWIERRNGPMIEIAAPADLEIVHPPRGLAGTRTEPWRQRARASGEGSSINPDAGGSRPPGKAKRPAEGPPGAQDL